MDGTRERHHLVDLLDELVEICKMENVKVPTKALIEKYNALKKCVTYAHYIRKFDGMEKLIQRFRQHVGLPEETPTKEPTLF
jgi:hypothetical protein